MLLMIDKMFNLFPFDVLTEKPGEKDQIESKGISSANELHAVLFMCLFLIVLYAKVA